jgi:hypothetical protein
MTNATQAPFRTGDLVRVTRGAHRNNMVRVVACWLDEVGEDFAGLHGVTPDRSRDGWFVTLKLFGVSVTLPASAVRATDPL